jgi:hypothetical protein
MKQAIQRNSEERTGQMKRNGLGEKWIMIFGTWNVTSMTGK